jgi:hypothetical protein
MRHHIFNEFSTGEQFVADIDGLAESILMHTAISGTAQHRTGIRCGDNPASGGTVHKPCVTGSVRFKGSEKRFHPSPSSFLKVFPETLVVIKMSFR